MTGWNYLTIDHHLFVGILVFDETKNLDSFAQDKSSYATYAEISYAALHRY